MLKSTSRLAFVLFCLTVLCLFLNVNKEKVAAASLEDGVHSGKAYKLYIPSGYDEDVELPLVVMLHGCTQNANQFIAGTEMNQLAEEEGFMVLYPEQPRSANDRFCWNWFEPSHHQRGAGEPAVIAGMVGKVKDDYAINEQRVYVAGLSAGGAMSAILGATYPDVFTAIGVASGLEYKAANNLIEAVMAMLNGGPDPKKQGELAFQAMGENARVAPTIVFHGTDDWTVRPINGEQVTDQWIRTNNLVYGNKDSISETPSETIQHQVPNGRSYTQYSYQNTNGQSIVEKYIVQGMGHDWSGGSLQGTHTDPKGPNASEIMWNFFKTKTKDGEEPTTVADPPGGEFDNPVNVELTADVDGTTYYTIDGTEPTKDSLEYTGPILIDVDTVLKFFTVGVNMKEEKVKTEIYTIKDAEDVTPTTIADPPGGEFEGHVTVELSADVDGITYYTIDGTEPTKGSTPYTEAILIEEDTVLKFFTVGVNMKEEKVKTEIYTIKEDHKTEIENIAIQLNESGFVGRLMADGLSNNVLKVGDKGMFNTDTYRSIISFDTSTLARQSIQSAKLVLFTKASSGTIHHISIDSKNGFFGSSSNLERDDFLASATQNAITSNANIPTNNGDKIEFDIPLDALNQDGLTQLRLIADTTAGFNSNLLEIYKSEHPDYVPYLEIELD